MVAFVISSAAILVAEVTVTRVPVWQPTSTVNVTVFGIPAYLILAEVCHAPLLVSLLPRCSTDFLCWVCAAAAVGTVRGAGLPVVPGLHDTLRGCHCLDCCHLHLH